MKVRNSAVFVCMVVAGPLVYAQKLSGPAIQIEADTTRAARDALSIKINGAWQQVLSGRVRARSYPSAAEDCPISKAELKDDALVIRGDCSVGSFVQHVMLTTERDIVHVINAAPGQ